jgi:hypothetical protein
MNILRNHRFESDKTRTAGKNSQDRKARTRQAEKTVWILQPG